MNQLFFRPFSPIDPTLTSAFQVKLDLSLDSEWCSCNVVAPRPRKASTTPKYEFFPPSSIASALILFANRFAWFRSQLRPCETTDEDAEAELQSILVRTLENDFYSKAPPIIVPPSPDLSAHLEIAFSPPSRAHNPLPMNSPFHEEPASMEDADGAELGLFSISPPPSARSLINERRRRLRSFSAPERGPLIVSNA
jgi:hypothetical protein